MVADKILNFIDGEYVATDKWYENRNPINNKVIGMVAEAGAVPGERGQRR